MKKMDDKQLKQLNDQLLVSLAKQGENRAFDILLGRNRNYIYNYLTRLIADPDAVEDIIQESYLKVYKSIHQFREDASFKSWLFAIARNTWKNYLRSHQYLNRIDQYQDVYDIEIASVESIEESIIQKGQSALLQNAIQILPNKQRATMLMRINAELPFNIIADMMDCSVSTVKTNHYFASKSVKKILAAAT